MGKKRRKFNDEFKIEAVKPAGSVDCGGGARSRCQQCDSRQMEEDVRAWSSGRYGQTP
jgi:hypothetical protein